MGRRWRAPLESFVALPGKLQSVERRTVALGTDVSIIALHERPEQARRAIEAAFAALERVEQVMNLWRPDSQLSQLNRAGRLGDPHPDMLAVLRYAAEVSGSTGGAFDVTVQPLWDIYEAARKQKTIPSDQQIGDARKRVDWRGVHVSDKEVRLADGTAVTLNGIAQGFAADRLLATLRDHGIEHAMVNSGEIATAGEKAPGKPWTVGIQHPRRPDAYLALAALSGRCMSTSGDYETTFTDDRLYNHIFDPATGRSPTVFSSVTVVAPTATQADALSTAIFVLGEEKGMRLVRQTAGVDALVVLKDGRTVATQGFPRG